MSLLSNQLKQVPFVALRQVVHKISHKMDEVAVQFPNLPQEEYQRKLQEAIENDAQLQQMMENLQLCQRTVSP